MITVTNGRISRTFKPDDYGARTIEFTYNADPDTDLDEALAPLVALAEKYARQTPSPVQEKKRRLTGDEIVGEAHPPTPAPIEVAPTPASVSAPEPEPVVPVIPTAEDVIRAAQEAVKRVGVERRHEVTAVVNKFVDAPNMPIRSTPEAKRADLIAALAELGKSSDY